MLKRDGDINKSSVNSDGWNYNMDECPIDTCVHLLSDNKDILLPQMDFVGTITMDINKGYKTRGMCYWGDPDCFYRSEIIAWKLAYRRFLYFAFRCICLTPDRGA